MTYFQVGLDVPFVLGENAEFNHDPASWRYGVKPVVNIDLVLATLPIPDFTTVRALCLATSALALAIEPLTGLSQRPFTLNFDEQMEELGEFEGKALPPLACYEVVGELPEDDFARRKGTSGLIVSERALAVLRCFDLGDAQIVRLVS